MRRFLLLACLVLILAAAPARAEYLGVTYDWSASPNSISTTSGVVLQIIGQSGSQTKLTDSGRAVGIAPGVAPDSTFKATPYQLSVTLTDLASSETGVVTFDGTFSGSYANLSNKFKGATTEKITLGDYEYTVRLGSFDAPTSVLTGDITATITARAVAAPEPASLALAACMLPGLLVVAWRRSAVGRIRGKANA